MKKVLLGLAAVAGMFVATSCTNEVELNGAGQETTVTFSVGIDEIASTRAISDASLTDILYYEVYDATGTEVVAEGSTEVENLKANFSVNLVSGNSYKVAFWAQNSACTAYNTDDLKAVTIDYNDVNNNDETMDAFFASTTLTVEAQMPQQNVTLTRPFAQINVGVKTENFEALGIQKSWMKVTGYYTKINLLDGTLSGQEAGELIFALNTIPAAETENFTVENETYNYLSTTYVLAGTDQVLSNMLFGFEGANSYTLTQDNVPVKRNYRTNILTDQSMDEVNFSITIDPMYGTPDFTEDGELEEGLDAAEVTVSNVSATYADGFVTFSASYTGEVNTANFICTPATRAAEGTVTIAATVEDGNLTAKAEASQFIAGTSYNVTVEVNGDPVEATGSTGTPSFDIPATTEPDQPDQPGQEVTETFAFATNNYGLTVYDSSNSNGYTANGTVINQGLVELTINPGQAGAGCRFWSTGSAQQFRIMKGSNISVTVPGAEITEVTITGGKLQFNGGTSSDSSWSGSAETVTLQNPSSGSTVSLTEMTVTYKMK